jgi:hypothetical protein
MRHKDSSFYSQLHLHHGALYELLLDETAFTEVPKEWNIIVTDIKNSTQAVQEGKQQLVNLAATGSIVACLNISRAKGIDIPFFFGGDGATLLVPNEILPDCLFALQLHQERCSLSFDFYLRVGHRNVSQLKDQGAQLKIAKYKRNDLHRMPIILGDALQIAERSIKESEPQAALEQMAYNLDLQGMECKWDKIKPPQKGNEVLTLIISAATVASQSELYSEVLNKIDLIYGEDTIRHPISAGKLKMVHHLSRFKNEVQMKYKEVTAGKVAASWWRSVAASIFTQYTRPGKNYLHELIQLTETLLLDGSINTVITGEAAQRDELLAYLDQLEGEDKLKYGYYTSSSSILSCFVTAVDDYHIHFLDGDNGGYTQASKVLKAKM